MGLETSGGIAVAASQTLREAGRASMGQTAKAVVLEAPPGIAQRVGEPT
jgi:hypothetical protein